MRQLLSSNGLGLVLLGMILREVQKGKDSITAVNLSTQEGVNNALQLQGEIRGMNRVIDKFFDLAEGIEL